MMRLKQLVEWVFGRRHVESCGTDAQVDFVGPEEGGLGD